MEFLHTWASGWCCPDSIKRVTGSSSCSLALHLLLFVMQLLQLLLLLQGTVDTDYWLVQHGHPLNATS
jgi:hypothetical protein